MSAVSNTCWQEGFLSLLPAVRTHARIQFRRLRLEQREEAVQEAIASACVSYQSLAARGRLHVAYPATIATFAVQSVINRRHVGGHQDAAGDVLSPRAQKRHGLSVRNGGDFRPQSHAQDWKDLAIAERKAPIPDTAAFRVDFPAWLATLARRDRRIIQALIAGEPATAIARRLGLSDGRISQLRRRYRRDWHHFHGESAPVA